jgi:hypothetical protein
MSENIFREYLLRPIEDPQRVNEAVGAAFKVLVESLLSLVDPAQERKLPDLTVPIISSHLIAGKGDEKTRLSVIKQVSQIGMRIPRPARQDNVTIAVYLLNNGRYYLSFSRGQYLPSSFKIRPGDSYRLWQKRDHLTDYDLMILAPNVSKRVAKGEEYGSRRFLMIMVEDELFPKGYLRFLSPRAAILRRNGQETGLEGEALKSFLDQDEEGRGYYDLLFPSLTLPS